MNKDIIASIIFAVGCFLFFAIIVPQYETIADIRAVIVERQDLLVQRTIWRENVKNILAQYQSRQVDIDKLGLLLPEIKQIDQIISSLDPLSQQSGLQLKGLSVSVLNNANENQYKTTLINPSLSGSYPSLVNFLSAAEKNLRLYDISEINIGHDSNSSGNSLNFDIKISAYNIK